MSEQDRIAFEKFIAELDFQDIVHDTESIRNLYRRAWQAATAEANKQIEALEGEVELKDSLLRTTENIADALQSNNNDLREALEMARDYQAEAVGYFHDAYAGYKEHEHIQYDEDLANTERTISATPAESLAKRDDEVIERCAKAIDEMVTVYTNNCNKYKAIADEESTERNVNKGRAAISCAEVIRALKVEHG